MVREATIGADFNILLGRLIVIGIITPIGKRKKIPIGVLLLVTTMDGVH